MSGVMNFLETKFVPVAARIGAQRHLVAVRDGFAAIMPLIIAGSLGVLLNNMGIQAYQDLMTSIFGDGWKAFGGNIWWGTFAIMSLFIAFTVAYNLAKSYDLNPMSAAVLSFSTYFVLVPQVSPASGGWGDINWGFTNATALFAAILIAMVTTELFRLLSRTKALVISMPEGVPPAVAKAFAALLPSIIILSLAALVQMAFSKADTNLFSIITTTIQAPLMNIGNSMGAALVIAFLNHFFWFFGIHGSNILEPVMQAFYVPAVDANALAIAAGEVPKFIVTKSFFDAFVYMGGSGTTITLLAAIFVASKRKHYRMMAGMGAPAGLFNINEPIIFGLPIVLNPIFFIPFLLVPVVLTVVAYTATAIGLVPVTQVVIPWVTPPVIGGFLATGGSVMGAALSVVNLAIGFVIYLPFVLLSEKLEKTV
jgi:PTS system cellobiose-specific IIC component